MLRTASALFTRKLPCSNLIRSNSFLTKAYRCPETWNARSTSPILQKVNLEDFYNAVDQNHASEGVMSAIDVDIFANSMKDASYLDELRDLMHKLRLTADTGNTLPSTHYAAIRNYVECDLMQDILNILWDPLNYGIFLDEFTANILMDELLKREDYERAAMVASLVMLQEDFCNEITCALALYSSYKYLSVHECRPASPGPDEKPDEKKSKKQKVDELKIRIRFLRNPYFDDHFDLNDHLIRAGKTLAWISESQSDNLHANLQIIGWFLYKKYDKVLSAAQTMSTGKSPKVYKDVLDLIKKYSDNAEAVSIAEECIIRLHNVPVSENSLEDDMKILIENAINKTPQSDIQRQEKLFKSWEEMRQVKLAEQTARLDEARRIQILEEKQKTLKEEEQKLWFFENEEQMDLDIEKKIVYYPKKWFGKKKKPRTVDEGYIPPEILPKRQ